MVLILCCLLLSIFLRLLLGLRTSNDSTWSRYKFVRYCWMGLNTSILACIANNRRGSVYIFIWWLLLSGLSSVWNSLVTWSMSIFISFWWYYITSIDTFIAFFYLKQNISLRSRQLLLLITHWSLLSFVEAGTACSHILFLIPARIV